MTRDQPEERPNRDAPPDEDPMERRRDDATDPKRTLPHERPAESREPAYQDVDDRDGV
jgi:hypothetical protein